MSMAKNRRAVYGKESSAKPDSRRVRCHPIEIGVFFFLSWVRSESTWQWRQGFCVAMDHGSGLCISQRCDCVVGFWTVEDCHRLPIEVRFVRIVAMVMGFVKVWIVVR
ncbi:hypothetical protein L1049_028314 [Liquidambar formosana]|uniref:Uncharacterized protein n=1 Tax=Liquidambar formosana TaxID=63359 RepID=A0AAP0WWC5_LIQFO